jgi:uncharacterized protein YyaL (SSP411 family)
MDGPRETESGRGGQDGHGHGGPGTAKHTNRLAGESSPYLLQHAHNPVEWYPWGDEAFAEAQRRDVPVLVSIGYSTCYWCHVMERESFENEEIGKLLSELFVCIKVDREERPDVDDVYMSAAVLTRGSGGWPLNVFLEPKTRRPFWAGTYFPPEDRGGMPGLPKVARSIAEAWREKRAEVMAQAEQLGEAIGDHVASKTAPEPIDDSAVTTALAMLLKLFDHNHGGFGSAPKFPQPTYVDFLLEVRPSAGDDSTGDAIDETIRRTLTKMALGGLRDHVGGGFHRYCTDSTWTVPHFEKMLYDNAMLAYTYCRAAELTGELFYERVVHDTLAYVMREMTSPEGAFYSAQDAEVDHREGLNYLWTPAQVKEVLDAEDAAIALKVYGLELGPNFQDPHHPEDPAANVLRLADKPEKLAAGFQMDPESFLERLAAINAKLYESRKQRKQPHLDDKIVTSWNGLMIAAFARAARRFREQRYLAAASAASKYLLERHTDSSGELFRVSRGGAAKTPAFLEDFAFLAHGFVELHRALREAGAPERTPALDAACALVSRADQLFADTLGGFFDARAEQSDLFVRVATTHDGAMPSGVSVMLNTLIDLAELTGERAYTERAIRLTGALGSTIRHGPVGLINGVRGAFRLMIAGEGDSLAAIGRSAADSGAEGEEAQAVDDDIEQLRSSIAGDSVGGSGSGKAARALGAEEADRVVNAEYGTALHPVEVYAGVERVTVPKDAPAVLKLGVRIVPGFHVPAANPGPGGLSLVPFRVGIIGGSGVEVYADYPEGTSYGPAEAHLEPEDDLLVYSGEFELPVVLERTGEWRGNPIITVTFQPCNDTECLTPRTVELDVAVDRG